MSNLSQETVLVCCAPLFASLAERLGRDFKQVYLFVPHSGSFPSMNAGQVGLGLPNVELVDDVFGPHFEEIGLFCFPDLGHSALQVQLEKMGKRVWGARYSEELELYREVCKSEMGRVGLPVQPWKILTGITRLRAHLKKTENQFVKINRWRGVTESFFSQRYELVETKIDAIAHELGAFKELLEFIVEDDLPDRVEVGLDTFCIDGEWPTTTLVGLENKDCGYIGQVRDWKDIPEPLRRWNEKMAPIFERAGARTFVSTEIRIGEDLAPFMIDATIRLPSPPGELIQELVKNLSEVLWHGADGKLVEPEMAGKWGVEVILKSAWAESNHLPVFIPKKFEQFLKLYNPVIVDGRRHVVTQDEEMNEIGAVVGFGETLDDAIAMAREVGESVEGYGVKFSLGAVEQVQEQIERIQEIGVSPFKLEKPKSES